MIERKVTLMRILIFFAFSLVLYSGANAQEQGAMERIVAVVGKEIILKSDVEGQLAMIQQQDPSIDVENDTIREYVLNQLINERLVVAAAREDTLVVVTEDEVSQRMEMQIQVLVQRFGSEKRIEDIYGMSMSRIRRDFRDEIRKQVLVEKMRGMKFSSVKVSRRDVEEFYEEFKDSLPAVPERVSLYHIVNNVRASDDQKTDAHALALAIRDSVTSGGDFGDFARRYSADPGSAANGGDLGYVDKGKFVPAFETAAFAMAPQEISQPVESPFGYHVIQLIDKSATSINCRHILIKVGQSDADRERAQMQLKEIRQMAVDGDSFEDLARKFSDEKQTKGFGGSMGELNLADLPPAMKDPIAALKDGEISDPLPYAADPSNPGYHIIWREKTIAPHKPTLESDYKPIEKMAIFAKRQRLEQEWIDELREKMYWEKR